MHRLAIREDEVREAQVAIGRMSYLWQVVLLAAVYFAVAKLSLTVAIQPGYATAVWSPSGIALVAALLCGRRIWPAIWTGAALVNFTTNASGSAAMLIASGNTLEALVGAALIRRMIGVPHRFEHGVEVVKFMALAAACIRHCRIGRRHRAGRDHVYRVHRWLLRGAYVPPTSAPPQSATLGGLTYLDSAFSVTDAGGFAAIGNAPGTPNTDNLGSFTLTGAPFTYTDSAFDLRVTFTAPAGTAPATLVFASALNGIVSAVDGGGALIDFDNSPHHFTFTGGSFDFVVNDVSMTAGNTVPLTGQIVSVITPGVPEPEAYAMMLAGLGLMGFVIRRRVKTPA